MLEFKNVSFRYDVDEFAMMENLSFSVEDGEFVSVIGASGCGKSTIFRLINGLEKPQKGEILVDGKQISSLKQYSAFMPQKDLLFPWRTIEKNICLPMELAGVPQKEQEARCRDVLEQVGLLDYMKKYPKDLSGGMKQRVSFARTLLSGADMLLLDEPFSALDTLTKSAIHDWYLDVMERIRLSTLFITHDIDEAILLSDRIYLLTGKPGRVTDEIVIREPKPRRKDFNLTPEFLAYKKRILERL